MASKSTHTRSFLKSSNKKIYANFDEIVEKNERKGDKKNQRNENKQHSVNIDTYASLQRISFSALVWNEREIVSMFRTITHIKKQANRWTAFLPFRCRLS